MSPTIYKASNCESSRMFKLFSLSKHQGEVVVFKFPILPCEVTFTNEQPNLEPQACLLIIEWVTNCNLQSVDGGYILISTECGFDAI